MLTILGNVRVRHNVMYLVGYPHQFFFFTLPSYHEGKMMSTVLPTVHTFKDFSHFCVIVSDLYYR